MNLRKEPRFNLTIPITTIPILLRTTSSITITTITPTSTNIPSPMLGDTTTLSLTWRTSSMSTITNTVTRKSSKTFLRSAYTKCLINYIYARKHIILQFLNSFPQHDHYHDHEKTATLEHQHQQDHKNIHEHINIEPQQYWQRNPALVPALVSNLCENNPLLVKIIINNSSY